LPHPLRRGATFNLLACRFRDFGRTNEPDDPFDKFAAATGGVSPDETIGFIGERFDADAGLQYLNARYYDPRLGLFIQPDWFEVTEPGVGTNRYSYSSNDPVNLRDPGGNEVVFLDPMFAGPNNAMLRSILHRGATSRVRGATVLPSQGQIAAVRDVLVALGLVGGAAAIISPVNQTASNGGLELPEELAPERLDHILDGHRTGAGRPGATEFPEGWTDQVIVDAVNGVYWGGEESDAIEADY